LRQPSLFRSAAASADPPRLTDQPAPPAATAFRDWLKLLVSADPDSLAREVGSFWGQLNLQASAVAFHAPDDPSIAKMLLAFGSRAMRQSLAAGTLPATAIMQLVEIFDRLIQPKNAHFREVMDLAFAGGGAGAAGAKVLTGSLPRVALFELFRQGAAGLRGPRDRRRRRTIVRAESDVTGQGPINPPYDWAPGNIAFTFAGLRALNIDPTTLASFPEPFREGMAARAPRLNDAGPSAPGNWEGPLGLPCVHGYFTGGFQVGSGDAPIEEACWRALRADIRAFNDPHSEDDLALQVLVKAAFRMLGMDLVHIELGQDPYRVENDYAVPLKHRLEHFGFRDGLSQPFVDLGLGEPPPGGGTPDANDTWSPVAPGEIYLGLPDEDGECEDLPVNDKLRQNGTYIVFRKLEQDVPGFRTFLERRRPRDREAQQRLAAQFVGRWANGTPLVLSPDSPRHEEADGEFNDFRYAQDDPLGQKCPLGAHIRRANPRDIGGRGEVKRHRILRRSISYGGPLLPHGSLGDGEDRGLLFMAVNSRIDLQFEVIQADWINNGEFLGQAGLARCPLIGGNNGGFEDVFLEAGAAAPVTGLPRFVRTRGGDYFFAPSLEALRAMAAGPETFAVADDALPYAGFSLGDTTTPGLFDPDRLQRFAFEMYRAEADPADYRSAIPVSTPARDTMVFVGQNADVAAVLSDLPAGNNVQFSVRQYHQTALRITRGGDFLVSTDVAGYTADTRTRLSDLLNAAWHSLCGAIDVPATITTIAQERLYASLRRTAPSRRIDLVHDLAVQASYGILTDLYGTPGPAWLTELALSLPFGAQHVGGLPPDWLTALKGGQPPDPGMTSMQIWSVLILADVLGNLQSIHDAWPLSQQAGAEMLAQLDSAISAARANLSQSPPPPVKTLVDAFVAQETSFTQTPGAPYPGVDLDDRIAAYYRDVADLLLELAGDTIAAVPTAFGNILAFILDNNIDLAGLMPALGTTPTPAPKLSGIAQLIYEAERLNPVLPVLLRYCETDTVLPSGAAITKGQWVAAVVQIADLDPGVYGLDPTFFSLAPYLPNQPQRDPSKYLMFGPDSGNHVCWGRDKITLALLVECVKAAGLLQGLRGVAGAAGGPQKLLGITIGLPARFTLASSPAAPTPPGQGPRPQHPRRRRSKPARQGLPRPPDRRRRVPV